jgi:Rrf2 family iron-sulfur cluster assembly transcriptional regulator
VTHDLWATLNEKMNDYLTSVSLADVVSHQQGKQVQVIKHFRSPEKPAAPGTPEQSPEKVAA